MGDARSTQALLRLEPPWLTRVVLGALSGHQPIGTLSVPESHPKLFLYIDMRLACGRRRKNTGATHDDLVLRNE